MSRVRDLVAVMTLASLCSCRGVEPSVSAPSTVVHVAPAPVETQPQPQPEPRPAPSFEFAELREHIHEVYRYPPTACRLQALLGDADFAELRNNGGIYPNDLDEGSRGVSYYGRSCPQPDCESALTWVGPEGDLIVAMLGSDSQGGARIWTDQPDHFGALPLAVERFVGEREWGAMVGGSPGKAACAGPELEARRQRFLASAEHRGCDGEFSPVWTSAAVMPASGERAPLFSAPGEPGGAYVIAGDLVELGWPHADDPSYVCAQFVSLAGRRTTGWLAKDALIELPTLDPPARAELDRFVVGSTPAWLELGKPALHLGELSIRRSASDRVEIALERVMAGHVCGMKGALTLDGARVLVDHSTGCGAAGVVFNNGVFLWEDGGCSGARATCTGGYAPTRSRSGPAR